MNVYDLLQESAQRGNGRTLEFNQVVWLLQLIQNMDAALVRFQEENAGTVDAEVINYDDDGFDGAYEKEVIDDEQVLKGEGLDSTNERVDSPQQEETTEAVHEAL